MNARQVATPWAFEPPEVPFGALLRYQIYKWNGGARYLLLVGFAAATTGGALVAVGFGSRVPSPWYLAPSFAFFLLADAAARLQGAPGAGWVIDEAEASLPVSANRMALARILAFMIKKAILLVGATAFMLVAGWLAHGYSASVAKSLLALTGSALGSLLLVAAVSQQVERRERHSFAKVMTALGAALLVAAGLWFWWFGLLAAVLGSFLVAVLYLRTPVAVSVEPLGASAPHAASTRKWAMPSRVKLWFALSGWEWLALAITPGMAFVGSFYAFVMGPNWGNRLYPRVALQAHLPVKRRLLIWQCLLVPLLLYSTASVISFLALPFRTLPSPTIEFECRTDSASQRCQLKVPLTWWRFGQPEVVQAPDGESFRPEARRVGPAWLFTVHNPYETGPREDAEFISFQLSRALSDNLNLELTPRQVQQRYLSSDNWRSGLRASDYPELTYSAVSGPATQLSLELAVILSFFLLVSGSKALPNMTRTQRFRVRAVDVFVLLADALALIVLLETYPLFASKSPGIEHANFSIPARVLWGHYHHLWIAQPILATAAVIAILVAFLRELDRRFHRFELPPEVTANLASTRRLLNYV